MDLNLWLLVRLRDDAVRSASEAIDVDRFTPIRLLAAMPRLPRAHLAWLSTWAFCEAKGHSSYRVADRVAAMDWEQPIPSDLADRIVSVRSRFADVQKSRRRRFPSAAAAMFAAWSMVVLGLESDEADAEVLAGVVLAEALGQRPDILDSAVEHYKALVQCAEDGLPPVPDQARRRAAHHRDLSEYYSAVPGAHTTRTVRTPRWAVQRALALGWTLDELAVRVGASRAYLLDVADGRSAGVNLGDAIFPYAERLADDLVYALDDAAQAWADVRAFLVASKTLRRLHPGLASSTLASTPWLPGD